MFGEEDSGLWRMSDAKDVERTAKLYMCPGIMLFGFGDAVRILESPTYGKFHIYTTLGLLE
mgnify:FL=1